MWREIREWRLVKPGELRAACPTGSKESLEFLQVRNSQLPVHSQFGDSHVVDILAQECSNRQQLAKGLYPIR